MSVRVLSLGKTYSGAPRPTLAGVSFEVGSGRCAAILGPSGAGKSTLLRCLVGLETFDEGSIEIDGVRIVASPPGASLATRERALSALRGRTGLVFQSFELFPHLSVLDNCTLAPRKVKKASRVEAERRARALLGELGLGDKAGAFPEQLSGGQKQRVAIARALAMEPKVLLYDEPTSALDPALRGEVRQTLQRVAKTGVTQLVVTHDLDFARDATDFTFVLDGGRIAEHGRTADVFGSPAHDATKALLAG